MHGVPEDLPLAQFVGKACIQIGLGQFQIQFHFSNARSISVEGKWELRDEHSDIVDCSTPHQERESYYIHKIIDQQVCSVSINPPISFTLSFENQFALIVYDDSETYESFSIHPDGIYV